MAVGNRGQGCLEIGEGLDAVDFAGFDQRSDAAPGDAAFVMAGEERVFAIKRDRTDQVFDPVGVDLDAAVGQEGLQPVPVVVDVASRDLADILRRCACSQSPKAATSGAVRAWRAERRWPGETPRMSASTA